MVTIYDVLEVDEKASKEEIEKAYQRMILEYHKDPKLDEETNHDNELILNKLKLAYEILSDDEKRKQYDKDLANKRAEELIKNVSVQREEEPEKIEKEEKIKEDIKEEEYNAENDDLDNQTLSKEEINRVVKAAKDDFKNNLKKAQMAEEEYNKAYTQAYNNYLRKMGYKVKEPWTLKRIRNLIITILVIIAVCWLIWIIPVTKNFLIGIYEDNFVIKALVDICVMLFNFIISIFKK